MVSTVSPRRTLILARLELKAAIAILSVYETTKVSLVSQFLVTIKVVLRLSLFYLPRVYVLPLTCVPPVITKI